jgi:hypothetical protein
MNTDAQTVNDTEDDLDTELDKADSSSQSLQDLLKQKNELRAVATESIERLIGKQKFNRKDIVRSFCKLRDYLDFVDSFQELILNDLQIIDGRFRGLEENLFKIGQQQSIVTAALKEKSVLTDDDMLSAWETIVKPTLQSKIAEMQKASAVNDVPLTTAAVPEVVADVPTSPTETL